jgi:hypothetical protein
MPSFFRSSTFTSLGLLNVAAVAAYAFASVAATDARAETPPLHSIACLSAKTVSGGTPHGLIWADTPASNGGRLFQKGSAFTMQFVTNVPVADRLNWSVQDDMGNIRGSGWFDVPPGTRTSKLSCTGTASGYFALTATLSRAGGTLPKAGTRPRGIATFGVLPDVSSILPPAAFTSQDQHRFGMQGENDKPALLNALGVTQVIDWRQLSVMEPERAYSWKPTAAQSAENLDPVFKTGQITRLIRLDGVPAWASRTGAPERDSYAPKDLTYFENYMARVGADAKAIREAHFPNMQHNYYQVTWEPLWSDSSANFVAMYKAAWQGIHSTDPRAVVMGVASPDPGMTGEWSTGNLLHTYASLGLMKYVDGIATHSYYANHDSPSFPPELYDTNPNPYYQGLALIRQMRNLRAEMQSLKPNMRLWSTEVGIAYDAGITYANGPSSNQLYAQAAVAARTHLIVLGEGAQVTYFFNGSDYPGEVGFGTFFDLDHPQGDFHATSLSPKPEALAYASMTRIIDGTATLGHLTNLPASAYGYAFRRLGYGPVITALWSHKNANWPTPAGVYSPTAHINYALKVDSPGTSGKVTVFDMMGNPTTTPYTNGVVNLSLSEAPIYVVSANANVIKANVEAPVGYTGQ